jgi:hypothetical protein
MSTLEGQESEVKSREPESTKTMASDFDFATRTSEMFTFLVTRIFCPLCVFINIAG